MEGQSSGSNTPGMGAYWVCSRSCKERLREVGE